MCCKWWASVKHMNGPNSCILLLALLLFHIIIEPFCFSFLLVAFLFLLVQMGYIAVVI